MLVKFRVRVISLTLALLLVVVLGGSQVFAQGSTNTKVPGSWASSVNLQNLENSNSSVSIEFYDSNGNLAFTHNDTLSSQEGKSYYLPALTGLSTGQYAGVVNSNGRVEAVVNSLSSSPSTGYSYNGLTSSQIATSFSFPGLYNNYFGFFSEVVLQNPNSSAATVTLAFNNASGTTNVSASVPANSSRVFALQDLNQLGSGNSDGLYSLSVTSDQTLAALANIWSSAQSGQAGSYNSFTSGSTTAYAPALYNNYFGFSSALTVQNVSANTATGTVTYSNGQTESFSLDAGKSVEYFQPNNTNLPSGNTDGVFSAKVEADNEVVTLVSINQPSTGLFASYNGATSASTTVNVPVALKSYFGYFSAITVQNVGTSSTTATVTFASGQSTNAVIPASGTHNFIQLDSAGDPVPAGTSTSAVVTADQPLVVVVQENSPDSYNTTPGDYLFAYTAVAQ